jgi:hypothetical protein
MHAAEHLLHEREREAQKAALSQGIAPICALKFGQISTSRVERYHTVTHEQSGNGASSPFRCPNGKHSNSMHNPSLDLRRVGDNDNTNRKGSYRSKFMGDELGNFRLEVEGHCSSSSSARPFLFGPLQAHLIILFLGYEPMKNV